MARRREQRDLHPCPQPDSVLRFSYGDSELVNTSNLCLNCPLCFSRDLRPSSPLGFMFPPLDLAGRRIPFNLPGRLNEMLSAAGCF